MARDWEGTFRAWSEPPSQTEQDKAENAERAVLKAVRASASLSKRNLSVFAQGSYRNRTNVRAESDVDICVCCRESIFYDLPPGGSPATFGIVTPAPYPFATFKDDLESALRQHFGSSNVRRGNKAFDIHENTYRIAADAIPTFEYRQYARDGSYRSGTAFLPDEGNRIENRPDQNYENGVAKNARTNQSFKGMVRLLKRLRNEMAENNVASAPPIPSFLIECLTWNVPDEGFAHATWRDDVRFTLARLFAATKERGSCNEWCEINDIKYLFHGYQPWTLEAANAFLSDCWTYVGFEVNR